MPPWNDSGQIMETWLKCRYKYTYLIIRGEFSQWPLNNALKEFLEETTAGPT